MTNNHKATLVPCCQIESCGKPLHIAADRHYLWISNHAYIPDGEQIVICTDCRRNLDQQRKP